MPLGKTSNPLLLKTEQSVQAKIPPASKEMFERVVHAGLTIMYAPQFKALMQKTLTGSTTPEHDAGEGAARMMGQLGKQSNGKLTMSIAVPASVMFVCEFFDLYAQVTGKPVTPDMIAKGCHVATDVMLQAAGVKQQQIAAVMHSKNKGAAQPGQTAPQPAGGIIRSQMQAA